MSTPEYKIRLSQAELDIVVASVGAVLGDTETESVLLNAGRTPERVRSLLLRFQSLSPTTDSHVSGLRTMIFLLAFALAIYWVGQILFG